MTNCPHCNGELAIIRAGRRTKDSGKTFEMASWIGTGADTLERANTPTAPAPSFKQEPARAPTVESDVAVPLLRSVVTGVLFAGCAAGAALVFGLARPAAFGGVGFVITATASWLHETGELRRLMWRIEERIERDIDGDNQVGQPPPPVDNIVPVFAGPRTTAVDVPEPPPVEEGDRLVRLHPSTHTIRKRVLWSYLLEAFMVGDWTRDGRPSYIKQKEWADVRTFVHTYWPDVWETTDRPTLDAFVRKLGCTVTNGTERNERNGGA